MSQWANYGVMGIMFGAGAGSQSHYFDYDSDGITNPPPINGNNTVSTLPDDDGGYIRLQVSAYYVAGTLPLPNGGGSPTPTATNTPAATATPGGSPVAVIGHVMWQGRPAQPNSRQSLPVGVSLRSGSGPVYNFNTTTDLYGFFTVTLGTVPGGTYNWRVQGTQCVASSGSANLSAGVTSVEMGTQHTGDANHDNTVNVVDFNIV